MTKTQRKSLLKLADFIVEKVPQERFDMEHFGTYSCSLDRCDTAGCALGWCTVLFKKQGVSADYNSPTYKGLRGYSIAAPLFGLTYSQSETLFGSKKEGRSAKQVRRDILRLVAKLDKEAKPK